MSLPQLYQPPGGSDGWREWWFWHYQDHLEIVQALQKVGFQLTVYDIDPWIDANKEQILEFHQQFHNDFNQIIGAAGNDLSDVDFKKGLQLRGWVWLNYQEHQNAHQALGI